MQTTSVMNQQHSYAGDAMQLRGLARFPQLLRKLGTQEVSSASCSILPVVYSDEDEIMS